MVAFTPRRLLLGDWIKVVILSVTDGGVPLMNISTRQNCDRSG